MTIFKVMQKLKIVKVEIKKWSKEEGRSECMYILSLLQEIETIDRREGEGDLSIEDLPHKESSKFKLSNRLQMKETSWRQKSRARWRNKEDRNTIFS